MVNISEKEWTQYICERLSKELDSKNYRVNCMTKIPYKLNINSYIDDDYDIENVKYEVDIVIKEKLNNMLVPRIIIETKYKTTTSHDILTYNAKAEAHKSIYSGLKYGFIIGECEGKSVPIRLIENGNNFDFMFAFENFEPNNKEWDLFIDIVKKNLDSTKELENIKRNKMKKDKKRYICVEKEIKFYERK